MPSLDTAIDQMVSLDRTFEPAPSARDYYDTRFEKYRELYTALRPFNEGFR